MNQTWNQHVVKKENKTLVLEIIKNQAPISRADVAQVTGLNKGTVSSLVSELIKEQLIQESGPGESSGGRRPVMLLFNHLAGYSIGIDLGVNYLLGVLTDLDGNIVHERKVQYKDSSYQEIMQQLFESIDDLIASTPSSHYGVIGIGIGVPGIVSNEGEILLAPNLNWKRIKLKKMVEDHYELPVIIENEANAGAYGEKMFGVGQDCQDIVYVSAGVGIGIGLILNGSLYKGSAGFSGELGHMTIEVNGLECSCGNKGCWELYASEQALIRKAEQSVTLNSKGYDLTLDRLNQLAESDKEATSLFEEIGDYLGVGITTIVNTFNPEQIIIGNRLASTEKWVKPALINRITNYALKQHQNNLKINFSKLNIHSTAMGVIAFTIEKFLEVDLTHK
ncbi:ROK family transcriptional regulator [Aquibacillus rhizosphaerae]|uniref:ROK family transcriptional regulator n=1 Tax=Aquibacillus rhizosphaerae TaxID=3051431 RepID=A0ABT7L360_9BACI|nr:ROK family transcriptional regulator [Aquibacillus sp. LR5S19]MDL4840296.1 ROK family transcriptional regulator [Aquibacillus sp. LR5S19]